MEPSIVGGIGIVLLLVILFLQLPIAFTMTLIGLVGFGYLVSPDASLRLLATDFYDIFSSYNLTVAPLFILMGQIAFHSGISGRLFACAYKFMGNTRGGLAIATIAASAGFASICGSTNASAATMATVSLPEMKKYQYNMGLATGTVAAGGTLGILIPPSTIFIIYGIMTEQSIGTLFLAGIVPGILLSILFILTVAIIVRLKPEMGPAGPVVTWREKFKSLGSVFEMFLIFVLVMTGLFKGFFTPTEAGAAGAGITLAVAALRRMITFEAFMLAVMDTVKVSCMVLTIIAGATIFGHFLAITRIPYDLAATVQHLPLPGWTIIGIIIAIYFIGGCFMDSLAMILLTIPIFFPVIISLGYDPVWFGVIIVLVGEMGVITPPVGINVYVVNGVAKDVPLHTIFKGCIPFVIALVICNFLLIFFPKIALFLPNALQ
ncbi:MAG: TRAP transporter large permease [Desulfopila sp.]